MTHLAIVLVHNKTDQENIDQINTLKSLLTEVVDGPFTNEETGESWTTIHHELKNLVLPHEVKVYQVVPYGVTPPPNRGDVNSGGIVYYGAGDEDKTGDHPRFFNWGLKRATDHGAEVVIHLEDISKFNETQLSKKLSRITDKQDRTEFAEDTYGKLSSVRLLKEVGQLKEGRSTAQAINDYKARMTAGGLE